MMDRKGFEVIQIRGRCRGFKGVVSEHPDRLQKLLPEGPPG